VRWPALGHCQIPTVSPSANKSVHRIIMPDPF
jgi:hypothetical protein